jgi:hypothetical protein
MRDLYFCLKKSEHVSNLFAARLKEAVKFIFLYCLNTLVELLFFYVPLYIQSVFILIGSTIRHHLMGSSRLVPQTRGLL